MNSHSNHAHVKIILAGCGALFGGLGLMALGTSDIPVPGILWKGALAAVFGVVLLLIGVFAARR